MVDPNLTVPPCLIDFQYVTFLDAPSQTAMAMQLALFARSMREWLRFEDLLHWFETIVPFDGSSRQVIRDVYAQRLSRDARAKLRWHPRGV